MMHNPHPSYTVSLHEANPARRAYYYQVLGFDPLTILRKLRGPGGCAWDQRQDLASAARFLSDEVFDQVAGLTREVQWDAGEEIPTLGVRALYVLLDGEVEIFSLIGGIDACRDILEAGGGHEMAAGLSIREENLEAFRERFSAHIASVALNGELTPSLKIDIELDLEALTLELLDSYELLRPFGNQNPQPVMMTRGVDYDPELAAASVS